MPALLRKQKHSADIEILDGVRRRRAVHESVKRFLNDAAAVFTISTGHLRWRVCRAHFSSAVETILNDPDVFLARDATVLKDGRRSTVGAKDGLVLKRYTRTNIKALKDLFRRSRAMRDFCIASHLKLAGILTAQPIAVAEEGIHGASSRSYFLMEEIALAKSLNELSLTPRLLEAVAQLIARLHNAGFSHRDLKNNNILCDGEGRLVVIDLEQVHYHGSVPEAKAQQDIDRFLEHAGPFGEFLRRNRDDFLDSYAEHCENFTQTALERFRQSALVSHVSLLIRSPLILILESTVG